MIIALIITFAIGMWAGLRLGGSSALRSLGRAEYRARARTIWGR